MGENGPVSWDRAEKAARTQGAACLDPIALEERLKVARTLRAQALAKRGPDPRPRTVPRPACRARPSPLPEPAEFAPRLRHAASSSQAPGVVAPAVPAAPSPDLPVADPAPAASFAKPATAGKPLAGPFPFLSAVFGSLSPSARRVAPPLGAMLALALVASLAQQRDLPDAPAAPAPASFAAAAFAAPPPKPESPLLALPSRPSSVAAKPAAPRPTAEPAGPEFAAKPAPSPLPGPAAAGPFEAPSLPVLPAPPAPAAPPASRVLVHLPSGVSGEAVEPALAALRARGVLQVVGQATDLTIAASTVRFYNAEDAAAAAEIAALVAPLLPGGRAEARDFTAAPSRAAPGNLEIWVAGASAPRAAQTRSGSGGVGIRSLVESVAAPAVARDVIAAAGGLESGAQRAAR